ncbi:MAG TPA: hypothetical protein VN521_04645 [Negativicutes bacterium]|nr:hypothetical protein [Negativicutes bacterium]
MPKKVLAGLAIALLLSVGLTVAPAWGAPEQNPVTVPVDEWTGKIFVVLPLEAGKKAEGYAFTFQAQRPELLTAEGNIRADWLEGKRLEVVMLKPQPAAYEVVFRETSSGTTLTTTALNGWVEQLVLADDLTAAQKHFAGTKIYSKRLAIPAYQENPGTIQVKINEPLTVDNVIAGINAAEPIWLVVSTVDKRKGYIAIAYSLTNVQQGVWPWPKPWTAVLFEENPQTVYSWDDETWTNINAGVAKQGMIPDQVRLAWGEPQSVLKTDGEETWYYPDKVVKFHPQTGLYLIQTR